jgi:hypothetical protein
VCTVKKWKGHGKEGELGEGKRERKKRKKDTKGLEPFLFCLGIPSSLILSYYIVIQQ